ncbi:MAG TPA: kelch repeat-containing protein [Rudaea sp.]|nr:kelch repeat-containing protein [Rudaea sp.]
MSPSSCSNVVRACAAACAILAAAPARAQTWTPLANQPDFIPGEPLLLTDGTVMVQASGTNHWWRLTPDSGGSYVNGTWSPMAAMPADYAPLYYASAVLPDARVVVIGGEYNDADGSGDTALGAIYDPKTDVWSPLAGPTGWLQIGDSPSVVLADGTFMIGNAVQSDPRPALLDANSLTWTFTGALAQYEFSFSEQGFTLLPNGQVLTIDVGDNVNNSEIYTPSAGKWGSVGSTAVQLVNPHCAEIGPAVLMPDGKVFATGSTSNTAIYDPANRTWTAGPTFPDGVGVADGPAALLPNGNVLVQASPVSDACFQSPSEFFEFDGQNLNRVPPAAGADVVASNAGLMLVLPTGQIYFSGTGRVQIYTSAGTYQSAWAPAVTGFPAAVFAGEANYPISGTQFNGLSQGAMYGDDSQMATNYPLVRIVNKASGHVFYARTHDHSSMGVATGTTVVSTHFDVPATVETGPSSLAVVANGIPSPPVDIDVKFSIVPAITGNWYDPAESGMGFSVEVLPGNVMLAQWYAFSPNGGPVWITASGPIVDGSATLDAWLTSGPGGRFPPNFNGNQVANQPWGKITFTFDDCDSGRASWAPTAPGYTPGAMPIKRLTMPAGLSCG